MSFADKVYQSCEASELCNLDNAATFTECSPSILNQSFNNRSISFWMRTIRWSIADTHPGYTLSSDGSYYPEQEEAHPPGAPDSKKRSRKNGIVGRYSSLSRRPEAPLTASWPRFSKAIFVFTLLTLTGSRSRNRPPRVK